MTYRQSADRFVHAWLSENLDTAEERYSIADIAQALREQAAQAGITAAELEKALGATVEEAIIVTMNAKLHGKP